MRYMSKLSTAYSQEPMTSYWALCLTSSVKALKCNYNYKYNYKSLFSFLRQLSMRHCLHLLLLLDTRRRAATDQYLLPTGWRSGIVVSGVRQ